jgi:ferredoxin-thioredoxin reductase catalytic chain
MSDAIVEARKNMLRNYYEKIVDALGYKFTPDTALVEFLLEQEVKIEQRKGSPFCPCQALTGEREHDMKLVCPCVPFHRKHYDTMKRCWCGLFVHKDVTNPDELLQIAPNKVDR